MSYTLIHDVHLRRVHPHPIVVTHKFSNGGSIYAITPRDIMMDTNLVSVWKLTDNIVVVGYTQQWETIPNDVFVTEEPIHPFLPGL